MASLRGVVGCALRAGRAACTATMSLSTSRGADATSFSRISLPFTSMMGARSASVPHCASGLRHIPVARSSTMSSLTLPSRRVVTSNLLRFPVRSSRLLCENVRSFGVVGHVPRSLSMAVAACGATYPQLSSRRGFAWWNKMKESMTVRANHIDPKTGKKLGWVRGLIKEYGMVGVGTYLVIDVTCLSATYVAFKSGVDVGSLLDSIGISHPWLNGNSSTFVLAYAFYKILAPLRLALAIAITPIILRKFRSLGWVKMPPPTLPSPGKPLGGTTSVEKDASSLLSKDKKPPTS
eukprot:Opistho-2@12137